MLVREVIVRVQLQSFSMAFEDEGQGQPLLLIHGYPLNRSLWAPQIAGLADGARLIAPDLRGFGESDPLPGPYSMERLADDCCALLDVLGVTQPVVVCGLSMGGYVTLAFYNKYAARVAGLILAATRAEADSPEAKAARSQAAELARREGVGAIVDSMLPKLLSPYAYQDRPELVAQVRHILGSASLEGMVGALLGMRDRPDATPMLASIDRPALILHGADDQIISLQQSQALQAPIPQARLEILPAAGHLLNLEQPGLFNEAVRRFLDTLDA